MKAINHVLHCFCPSPATGSHLHPQFPAGPRAGWSPRPWGRAAALEGDVQPGPAGVSTVAPDPAQRPWTLILPAAHWQGLPGTQAPTGASEGGSLSLGEVRSQPACRHGLHLHGWRWVVAGTSPVLNRGERAHLRWLQLWGEEKRSLSLLRPLDTGSVPAPQASPNCLKHWLW